MKEKIYEVTLTAGHAEAVMLIAAQSKSMVRRHVEQRLKEKNVCWERTPDGPIMTRKIELAQMMDEE